MINLLRRRPSTSAVPPQSATDHPQQRIVLPPLDDATRFNATVEASLDDLGATGKRVGVASVFTGVLGVVAIKLADSDLTAHGRVVLPGGSDWHAGDSPHALMAAIIVPLFLATQIRQRPDPDSGHSQVMTYVLDGVTSFAALAASIWSVALFTWSFGRGNLDVASLLGWILYSFLCALSQRQGGLVRQAILQRSVDNLRESIAAVSQQLETESPHILTEDGYRKQTEGTKPTLAARAMSALYAARPWVAWYLLHAVIQTGLLALLVVRTYIADPVHFDPAWVVWIIFVIMQVTVSTWGAICVLNIRAAKSGKHLMDRVTNILLAATPCFLEALLLLTALIAALEQWSWASLMLVGVFAASCSTALLFQFYILPNKTKASRIYLHNTMIQRLVRNENVLVGLPNVPQDPAAESREKRPFTRRFRDVRERFAAWVWGAR